MTYAPDTLKAARTLLLARLDMHPGSGSYPADLDPDEVGIVGDTAHAVKGTSYHLGKDQLVADAYSARTARDRAGLSDAASALDIGQFVKGSANLRHFTGWLFAQCRASAPDTLDLREVIGTVDGKTVLRWDAERGRSSAPQAGEADDSHLWHTHLSRYRDAEFRPLTPLLERYLREIGLTGDDMDQKDLLARATANPNRTIADHYFDEQNLRDWWYDAVGGKEPVNPPPPNSRADLLMQAVDAVLHPQAPEPATAQDIAAALVADPVFVDALKFPSAAEIASELIRQLGAAQPGS